MVKMSVSYNKLWKLLVDKKMSKADLRRAADISPNTLTKLLPGFWRRTKQKLLVCKPLCTIWQKPCAL